MADPCERSEALYTSGSNCAQAVFTAFCDEFGIDEELARRLACGFGGGLGRQREVCGAVAGATMILGLRHGPDRTKTYAAVQDFCNRFRECCGSILCRDLLAGTGATSGGAPEPRTQEYYNSRPCGKIVRTAARLLMEMEAKI